MFDIVAAGQRHKPTRAAPNNLNQSKITYLLYTGATTFWKMTSLPPCGWLRFRPNLSKDMLAALLAEVKTRDYIPVFKTVGSSEEDKATLQSRLPMEPRQLSDTMQSLHQELCDAVRCLDQNYCPSVYSFMKSLARGEEQAPHKDYTPQAIAKVTALSPLTMPCSMIIALEKQTRLKVFDSCFGTADPKRAIMVDLIPGECLLFRGDLIHCGVAFKTINYRLHCYVTIPGVEFVPDMVAGVNQNELECGHCDKIDVDSHRIREHRRYCKRNPNAKKRVRDRSNRPKEPNRKCPGCCCSL